MGSPQPPVPDSATQVQLALERTRVAYDRTMLAWVRTAASLITFGFTAYKFFDLAAPRPSGAASPIGMREFGLALVGVGVGALLLATFEYRRDMRSLAAQLPVKRGALALGVATLVGFLGVLAVVAMLLGW